MNQSNTPTKFHPTSFLAALGAGGISVAPFAIMQYAMPHDIKGLITHNAVYTQAVGYSSGLVATLELMMIAFGILHFVLLAWLGKNLYSWIKQEHFQEILRNPYQSSSLLTPLLALAMSFNVFIGTVRYFWPALHQNLQAIMPYAFGPWVILFLVVLATAGRLLKHAFEAGIDLSKLPFGWMQYPMTIAMVSVTGTGFAAMSQTPWLAHSAFMISLIGLASAAVIFIFNLVTLFQHHFAKTGYPDKQAIPSMMAMIPIVTLFGVATYRITHYLHRSLHIEANWLATLGVTTLFALQMMMLAFMMFLLNSFLKNALAKDEYYPSLWALICPFVGFAVLSAFTNTVFVQSPVFTVLAMGALGTAIALYTMLLRRMLACKGLMPWRSTPQCA